MRMDEGLNRFLAENGLGEGMTDSAINLMGRNSNFSIRTSEGRELFVKKIDPRSRGARARIDACSRIDAMRRAQPSLAEELQAPSVLAVDVETGFIAYELLPGARGLSDVATEKKVTADHGSKAGRALAALHAMSPVGHDLTADPSPMPPLGWFESLPWQVYSTASAPQLQVWNRMQRDDELIAAVSAMRDREAEAATVPIHGDIRLDQFAVCNNDVVHLLDWEELRMGDPARDVGAYVGEWLHRAILDSVQPPKDDQDGSDGYLTDELDLTHEEVLLRGVESLDRHQHFVTEFWTAYTQRVDVDAGFAERVAAVAGWHLIDRLLAASETRSRLSAFEWAAAGIGRQALLEPGGTATTLGLVVPETAPAVAAPTTADDLVDGPALYVDVHDPRAHRPALFVLEGS